MFAFQHVCRSAIGPHLHQNAFSWVYYIAPAYVLFVTPYLMFNALVFRNSTIWTWIILAPLLLSAALPAFKVCQPTVLGSWIMAQMPKYFDYVEVLEIDDENLAKLAKVGVRGLGFQDQSHPQPQPPASHPPGLG